MSGKFWYCVKTSYYPSSPGTQKSDFTDRKSFPAADKTLC